MQYIDQTPRGKAKEFQLNKEKKMKICIIGASGKLGKYMVQHALDRGYEVVGVCRERSVSKLETFKGRITIIPGATNDREVIEKAVAGCNGVLTVLVPWGNQHYSSGTAQAVLDYAPPGARLIFSCGWHITRDGKDVYPPSLKERTRSSAGSPGLFPLRILTTRWKRAGGFLRATPAGRSYVAAILRRVRARDCPYGVAMSVIPFSPAI